MDNKYIIQELKRTALQYHKWADLLVSYKTFPLLSQEYRNHAITLLATIDIICVASGELK